MEEEESNSTIQSRTDEMSGIESSVTRILPKF